jgi:rhamnosyltransferase
MTQQSSAFPTFAVCLAAYNGLRWLPEQISSILSQLDVSVTVFVSVDRSSDGTEAWIDELSTRESRIKVLPHGEVFGGAGRNFFRLLRDVDFTHFDYLSFADQDDVWLPNKLSRAHQVLLAKGADAYSSDVAAYWPDGREELVKKSYEQAPWDFLFESAGPGCTYVLRKTLAQQVQSLVNRQWAALQDVSLHDWFVYAFVRSKGLCWVIDDWVGMRYRQHTSNEVGVNSGWAAFRYRVRKVIGGWALEQAGLIADLVGLGQHPFVLGWIHGDRMGMLRLALQASQCRRRGRDKVLFGLSCIALSVKGRRVS